MTNTVLLDNIAHQDLRVIVRHGTEFADNINQVLVFPTEFAELQREYPIFFRKDAAGAFQSVALLGFDRDENLFLDERGWQARYIPAIQARGPFMIGLQDREIKGEIRSEPMIQVDLDHPRIANGNGEGEPVFLPHGGNSPYLEHVAAVLRRIHQGIELSGPMFEAFDAAGLIEPVTVEIKLSETEQFKLQDYYTIGEERLAQLDGETLARLNAAGYLGLAFLAAASLGNVSRLIDMKNARRGAL